ncbi:hypothetical protein [Thermithiobacillus plumbiphilus]|uniref:Uncharacterized protein n=1 Tax=Thermithiobacillus plumbiphilus TaxID=1729899 RepID=A0ABU9D664_9PROT
MQLSEQLFREQTLASLMRAAEERPETTALRLSVNRLQELIDTMSQSVRQLSRDDLEECTKTLLLELAYYKVKHTIATSEALLEISQLSTTKLTKVLTEANNELLQVQEQVRIGNTNVVHFKGKLPA